VRSFASGGKLNVLHRWCSGSLDDDERDDLAEAAAEALGNGDAGDDRTISRVAEAPPP
jgi:hypothetical protein